MPSESLKEIAPFGPVSSDRTGCGCWYAIVWLATPLRLAPSVTSWIVPVLKLPKKRSPLRASPRPHASQNATPVGAIVGVYHSLGRIGSFPSRFVFRGGFGG